jgi:cell division septum initiation protein DivIVA
MFLLPSMLFWPSSIGKEAWMLFALGIAAFGVARILSNSTARGLAITALGLWLAALVRPHLAGIMAIALAAAYLLRRTRPELRQLGPIVKGFSLAVLVVLAGILVVRTDRFLQQQGISTTGGASAVSSAVQERTGEGGSAFAPKSIIASPAHAPISILSVLFRPLPFDANNAQTLVTALEGTFLLLFSLVRIRWLIAAVKSSRRQPYVAFALLYTLLFVVGFSSVANFGLLARERVQLLPMYLVLFTIPRPNPRSGKEETMDEPRGNWLNDPPDTPRPRRPWRSNDPPQPDIANLMEHLQALEARTRELEAELRRERTAPPPPTPTEEPEPPPTGDDMTARFTELARRTFGEEFEHLRQEAQRQADEIVAHARVDADRRAQEILGRARDEAERMSSAARKQAEAAKAAKAESASRAKELANELRDLLDWIDRTLEELDESVEKGPDEESAGRPRDLVVIPSNDEPPSDETAPTSPGALDIGEEPAG